MYVDNELLLSDAQAVTTDAVGTNVIDLSVDRSIGNGEPMAVVFTIDVAADQTSGDEDYTFVLLRVLIMQVSSLILSPGLIFALIALVNHDTLLSKVF